MFQERTAATLPVRCTRQCGKTWVVLRELTVGGKNAMPQGVQVIQTQLNSNNSSRRSSQAARCHQHPKSSRREQHNAKMTCRTAQGLDYCLYLSINCSQTRTVPGCPTHTVPMEKQCLCTSSHQQLALIVIHTPYLFTAIQPPNQPLPPQNPGCSQVNQQFHRAPSTEPAQKVLGPGQRCHPCIGLPPSATKALATTHTRDTPLHTHRCQDHHTPQAMKLSKA